jgi:nitric oxide reductase NorD protein
MEELVGEFWHRLITKRASTDHAESQISLSDLNTQLAPFYRALGGAPGKVIEGSNAREFKLHRRLLQRIAGTHRRTNVAWQDDRSVRFPPIHAMFPDKQLNEALYFWLAALAAQLPTINHWFTDNQGATLHLLETRPGLAKSYHLLVEAVLLLRPELDSLEGAKLEREIAIQQALKHPGSVDVLPKAPGDPYPISLWLYPEPIHGVSVTPDDELDDDYVESENTPNEKEKGPRKDAQRNDDSKETDGLLVFMLESLLSWTEQIDLDRPQEEDVDVNVSAAAEDLDLITLSRQRRAQSSKIKFDMDLPAAENDDLAIGLGIRLPEWDYKRGAMVKDFCFIQPMLADDALPAPVPDHLKRLGRQLKSRFSALNFQTNWQRRQAFGSELDLDACIENVIDPNQKLEQKDVYKSRSINKRDLSCLLLADLSMSTDSALNAHQRVIDVIRDSIVLFAEALSGSGDPFAIYGFSSIKNKQVRYNLLKNFSEPYSDASRGRILAVKPGFYTRMGAGIRQSIEVLKLQSTQKRLLLILSDGKPNDIDHYEGRYGIEDTRKAVIEAKRLGIQPFCITIDEDGNEYLPYLFGDQGYAVVSDIARLPKLLPKLYLNLTGQS